MLEGHQYEPPLAQARRLVKRRAALLRDVPVAVSAQRAAIGALRDLAAQGAVGIVFRSPTPRSPRRRRRQEAGVDVLHYDAHYDRLAQALNFTSVWVAPPGEL